MTTEKRQDLATDQRGAIMVIGLGAALMLIGALWFLMGIADTIVWRDKMQEAVDSAAFSSATIHARGMNFIAAMNLIILALVTIHLAIGIIADILTVVGGICIIVPICTPWSTTILSGAKKVRTAQETYDKFMWPAVTALNVAQTATAVAAPHLGSLAAVESGKTYATNTLALGASNFPLGFSATTPKDGAAGGNSPAGSTNGNDTSTFPESNVRLGLPVAFEPLNEMCKRPVSWIMDWARTKATNLPIAQEILNALPIKGFFETILAEVFASLNRYIGDSLAFLECDAGGAESGGGDTAGGEGKPARTQLGAAVKNAATKVVGFIRRIKDATAKAGVPFGAPSDPRWGKPGGKQIWGEAKNGSQWMQVWAWTNDAKKVDDEERKVGVARNKYGDIKQTTVKGTYYAQAEFYYDCGGQHKWRDIQCNGYGNMESHFTMYNMNWKARLRRFRSPSFSQFVFETAQSSAGSFGYIDKAIAKIPGAKANPFGGEYSVVEGLAQTYLNRALDEVSGLLEAKPDAEILH